MSSKLNHIVNKKFLLLFLLMSVYIYAFNQSTQNIDSLKKSINNSNISPCARDSAMFWASWYYLNVDLDSSFWYAQKAYNYSIEINCKPIEAFSLEIMGDVYWAKTNTPKALELLYQSKAIFEQLKDSLGLTTVNYDLANNLFNEKDTAKSFFHFHQALKMAPSSPLGNTVKSWVLTNLGVAYHRLNKDNLALPYAMQAYDLALKGSENKYLGTIYDLLSSVQFNSGNIKEALKYSRAAIAENTKNNNPNGLSDSYLQLAFLYKALLQADSAFYYAKKSLALNQQLKIISGVIKPGKILVELFTNKKRYDSALKYQLLVDVARDSVFNREKFKQVQDMMFNEQMREKERATERRQYISRLKMYGLAAGAVVMLIVTIFLLRTNRQKQRANTQLQKEKEKTDQTLAELRTSQAQLIQSEKMASLGQLTAGIAHEIQNPLNFVNNFSEVNTELVADMKQEIDKGNIEEVKVIANNLKENAHKIIHHGKRADAIVKGMLQHSRSSTGKKELTDINALCDEYLRLSYHGLRAKDKSFNAIINTDFDETIGTINIIPQDIGRMLLNLFTNAFYSVAEKKRKRGKGYEPVVSISTKQIKDKIKITVKDNGMGIPQNVLDKIYQPFFTTKPTGEGTGLGLSISYDIIKAHGAELKVDTKEGEFAEFIIELPAETKAIN